MPASNFKVTVQIRSSEEHALTTKVYTFGQLVSIFGKEAAEEVFEGWSTRHPGKPHLKFTAV